MFLNGAANLSLCRPRPQPLPPRYVVPRAQAIPATGRAARFRSIPPSLMSILTRATDHDDPYNGMPLRTSLIFRESVLDCSCSERRLTFTPSDDHLNHIDHLYGKNQAFEAV